MKIDQICETYYANLWLKIWKYLITTHHLSCYNLNVQPPFRPSAQGDSQVDLCDLTFNINIDKINNRYAPVNCNNGPHPRG